MTAPDEPGYAEVARFLVASGRRLTERAGRLPDLGVSKRFLTEEDLRIERELRALLAERFPTDGFVAEEEHDHPWQGTHWVVDPISGTHTFLAGLAHYGMVATRVVDGEPVFTAIHDPTTGELFTARAGGGAFVTWCHKKLWYFNGHGLAVLRPGSPWELLGETNMSKRSSKLGGTATQPRAKLEVGRSRIDIKGNVYMK